MAILRRYWGRPVVSLCLAMALALFCCLAGWGQAGEARPPGTELEYKVKAAFLLNFCRFITWPEAAWQERPGPFTMCVAGEDPFGPYLRAAEEKQIQGRDIRVKTAAGAGAPIGSCQLVFIATPDAEQARRLLKTAEGFPVVTVSDIQGFADKGGIVEFITQGGRLAFIINNTQARKQGLQISASLLSLAAEVR